MILLDQNGRHMHIRRNDQERRKKNSSPWHDESEKVRHRIMPHAWQGDSAGRMQQNLKSPCFPQRGCSAVAQQLFYTTQVSSTLVMIMAVMVLAQHQPGASICLACKTDCRVLAS